MNTENSMIMGSSRVTNQQFYSGSPADFIVVLSKDTRDTVDKVSELTSCFADLLYIAELCANNPVYASNGVKRLELYNQLFKSKYQLPITFQVAGMVYKISEQQIDGNRTSLVLSPIDAPDIPIFDLLKSEFFNENYVGHEMYQFSDAFNDVHIADMNQIMDGLADQLAASSLMAGLTETAAALVANSDKDPLQLFDAYVEEFKGKLNGPSLAAYYDVRGVISKQIDSKVVLPAILSYIAQQYRAVNDTAAESDSTLLFSSDDFIVHNFFGGVTFQSVFTTAANVVSAVVTAIKPVIGVVMFAITNIISGVIDFVSQLSDTMVHIDDKAVNELYAQPILKFGDTVDTAIPFNNLSVVFRDTLLERGCAVIRFPTMLLRIGFIDEDKTLVGGELYFSYDLTNVLSNPGWLYSENVLDADQMEFSIEFRNTSSWSVTGPDNSFYSMLKTNLSDSERKMKYDANIYDMDIRCGIMRTIWLTFSLYCLKDSTVSVAFYAPQTAFSTTGLDFTTPNGTTTAYIAQYAWWLARTGFAPGNELLIPSWAEIVNDIIPYWRNMINSNPDRLLLIVNNLILITGKLSMSPDVWINAYPDASCLLLFNQPTTIYSLTGDYPVTAPRYTPPKYSATALFNTIMFGVAVAAATIAIAIGVRQAKKVVTRYILNQRRAVMDKYNQYLNTGSRDDFNAYYKATRWFNIKARWFGASPIDPSSPITIGASFPGSVGAISDDVNVSVDLNPVYDAIDDSAQSIRSLIIPART